MSLPEQARSILQCDEYQLFARAFHWWNGAASPSQAYSALRAKQETGSYHNAVLAFSNAVVRQWHTNRSLGFHVEKLAA
jgi:hypothetical protein